MNRLYVSRKEEGRGLTSIEDCMDASIQGLENYIKKNKERLITASSNSICNIRTDRKASKTRKAEKGRKTTVWMF